MRSTILAFCVCSKRFIGFALRGPFLVTTSDASPMVLTGSRGRRHHAAFAFANMGCTEPCCEPGGRQIVTSRVKPLDAAQKFAFILAINKSFGIPRLLPPEVLRRIFDMSGTIERSVHKQPPPPPSLSSRMHEQTPELDFEGLSLRAPV